LATAAARAASFETLPSIDTFAVIGAVLRATMLYCPGGTAANENLPSDPDLAERMPIPGNGWPRSMSCTCTLAPG
jgi:hypothetical protein